MASCFDFIKGALESMKTQKVNFTCKKFTKIKLQECFSGPFYQVGQHNKPKLKNKTRAFCLFFVF